MAEPIERVGVVVPARDEEELLGRCLSSVERAARSLTVPVRVVVVVNGTTDRTAAVAARHGAEVLVESTAGVGAARRIGCAAVLDGAVDPARTWLACTDADSEVPSDWLTHQVGEADAGADAVLGIVQLLDEARRRHVGWDAEYRRRVRNGVHDHVHGANLGVRGSAYLAAGGFGDLERHEDADLVRRLVSRAGAVRWTDAHPVTTSARTVSRVVGGVATDLRLADDAPA